MVEFKKEKKKKIDQKWDFLRSLLFFSISRNLIILSLKKRYFKF